MTNQQAIAKAKKRWGAKFSVRAGQSFSSPERRTQARDTVVQARDEIKQIDEEVARRLKELDWYQELQTRRRKCREHVSNTEGLAHYYRFSVGTQNGVFFSVAGQGDTWEEAFAKANGAT